MAMWGDGMWENIAILHETAGLPIEPAPLDIAYAQWVGKRLEASPLLTDEQIADQERVMVEAYGPDWFKPYTDALTPKCRHCGDPFDFTDEDPEPRYRNLCIGCAEWFKDLDRQDALVIAHEDAPPPLR
jgi:hypothetical protein